MGKFLATHNEDLSYHGEYWYDSSTFKLDSVFIILHARTPHAPHIVIAVAKPTAH